MFLKRLDIVGFKSFTERCSVPFSPGISAVVGPNGCGKSNIIDAIRWVMGEQSPRLLRARNMEDILFNGSKGKNAAAMAEVTLTLSRDAEERGSAEIAVTRRLFRGGDSDYYINRIQSRLKDVLRFFIEAGMGTRSYAIIEQERVGRLVDARPEERRLLMDEAAGITRYKEQKKESERKLETATQNLTTVAGIMAESKKQLGIVAKAAAKAARHQAIRMELRGLELTLSAGRFLELISKVRELATEVGKGKEQLATLIATASEVELEAEALKLEDTLAAELMESELAAFHGLGGEFEKKKAEALRLEDSLASAGDRREKAEAELGGLDSEKEGYERELGALTELRKTLAQGHEEAMALEERAKGDLEALKASHEEAKAKADEAARALDGLKDLLARQNEAIAGSESLKEHLLGRRRSLELERNESANALAEARERIGSRERFKKGLEDELAGLEEALATLREDESEARATLESLVKSLGPAESDTAGLRAKLETLEGLQASYAWYPRATAALMAEGSLKGLLGAVAEIIEVPEGYEEAAEAALGDRLSYLAVKDRESAIAALKLAREKSLGRCGFVIGAIPKGGSLTEKLLGKFRLVNELGDPGKLAKDGVFLAKDGTYLSPGLAAGGKAGPEDKAAEEAGILQRLREKERTAQELDIAQKGLDSLKGDVAKARTRHGEAEDAVADRLEERGNLASDLSQANSKLLVAISEEKGMAIRHGSLDSEIGQVDKDLEEAKEKREESAKEKKRLEGLVSEAQERLDKAVSESEERSKALGELRERESVALSNANSAKDKLESADRELQGVNNFLKSIGSRKQSLEKEIRDLANTIESSKELLEGLRVELESFPDKVKDAENHLNALRESRAGNRLKLEAKEEQFKNARREREAEAEKLNSLEKDLLEASFGLGQLKENLLKDWQVTFIDPYGPAEPEPDPAQESPAFTEETESEDDAQDPDEAEEPDEADAPDEADGADDPASGQAADSTWDESEGTESEPQETEVIKPPELIDPHDLLWDPLPEDAIERVAKLKARIGSIGAVNLAAIEEEEELRKRYGFYQTQYDDLEKAIGDLRETIDHINQICRERFNNTFSEVDKKFQEIFPVLFEGGEGWLALSEHTDPLEAGVEIHVHPPGKKIMVMSLLSGGEKALTALALIFALYLIKPSPFCLLDEADAPLDEANIDRFNRLLRKLSEASQIIMVTHNKRTMQISDTLYGVTMETPGVSRLVSVSMSQAQVLTK